MTSRVFLSFCIFGVVTACVGNKDAVIPNEGPTMEEIYLSAPGSGNRGIGNKRLVNRPMGVSSKAMQNKSVYVGLEQAFPALPNPTLYMYVNKHLTQDGLPVMGYTTKFSLFDRNHYALPGELN